MLKPGTSIPTFALKTDQGKLVRNTDLRGRRFVLFFYPKDHTPGCTREACAFRDLQNQFRKLGVPVFGISADTEISHEKFASKHNLGFPLLSDPDHSTAEHFGVWVEKILYGRKYFGIQRSSFVINAEGRVEKIWEKVKPDGHAAEVLQYLKGKPDTFEPSQIIKATATKKTTAKASDSATAKTSEKKVAVSKAAKKVVGKKSTNKSKTAAK